MSNAWLDWLSAGDARCLGVISPADVDSMGQVYTFLAADRAVVRALALRCAALIDPFAATEPACVSLDDDDGYARFAAYEVLQTLPWSESLETRLLRMCAEQDTISAPLAAMLVHRGNPHRVIRELSTIREHTARDDVRRESTVTLAQLGEPNAQAQWREWLVTVTYEPLLAMLETTRSRLAASWVVPALCELLDRTENLRYVGVDGAANRVVWLRTCDVALPIITHITHINAPFVGEHHVNFTVDQRGWVQQTARRQLSATERT